MNKMQTETFDYKALDSDVRPRVIDATTRLHVLERKTGEQIVEIGRILMEVKERIGHGTFGEWLDAEFGWTDRTAQRFIQVATAFENRQIVGFAPSALYALASNSVPDDIRAGFIAKAEAGEKITHKQVVTVLRETRADLNQPAYEPTRSVELAQVDQESEPIDTPFIDRRPVAIASEREQQKGVARREQEVANRLMEIVGDPDGTIALSRLKAAYSKGVHATRRDLMALNSETVATTLDANDRVSATWFIKDMRDWLSTFESNLNRGIRLVSRKGA